MADKKSGICVSLSVAGTGYKVCILVNGKDTGLRGGGSQSTRLFSPTHGMAPETPTAMRKKLVLLKDGPNQIVIDFKKTGGAEDSLTVEMFAEGIDHPQFRLTSSAKGRGKVNRTLNLMSRSVMTMTDADLEP